MQRLFLLAASVLLVSTAAAEPESPPDRRPNGNAVSSLPFSRQAVAFLNTYWNEVGSEVEYIYGASWAMMKRADMRYKGTTHLHEYNEGSDVDFDMALYFYEELGKLSTNPAAQWVKRFPRSQPAAMTAIRRKQELRVTDTNLDGRVSFIEYLFQQYQSRIGSQKISEAEEDPDVKKARSALANLDKHIKAFEAQKTRLERESAMPGVRGLAAKKQLADLAKSPAAEDIRNSLKRAEAAVRAMTKKVEGRTGAQSQAGTVWWFTRELAEKKGLYP